jgi:hypothetical protein
MDATPPPKALGGPYTMLCIVISLLGWFPFITSAPMIHGGTFADTVVADAGIVLGGYCTIELIRRVGSRLAKLLWAGWLLPYVIAVSLGLYAASLYAYHLFAI